MQFQIQSSNKINSLRPNTAANYHRGKLTPRKTNTAGKVTLFW